MSDDPSRPETVTPGPAGKALPPAQRALAEAEARRKAAAAKAAAVKAGAKAEPAPKEFQGPQGPEPTRYGDWERKGIASDF
jgi:hypothetical protein